ncbi:hypothetical protein, partial [Mycolicibacterium fortuitum]|uniref:hypothetical protein n=1 Tax=Mycolicibacterium fortuitum TaxID=1766 RepID=UPI003AF7FEB9
STAGLQNPRTATPTSKATSKVGLAATGSAGPSPISTAGLQNPRTATPTSKATSKVGLAATMA